jgi:glycosyltransferase involved in cell wall biosynthesis
MLEVVGSVAPATRGELETLRREPNVRYIGHVPYGEVPDVLARFSVGLIPFEISDYTRAVNPIKLYEYAAFDLPIVTTAFSPDIVALAGCVDVCDSAEQFIRRACELAQGARAPSTRAIARAHTWERMADAFAEAIDASM